jgi:hypothetical protein
MNGQLSKTSTITQINRIRETIDSLNKSENLVRQRLEADEPSIRKDNLNHANEIIWGWKQLLKEINSLPESFIDKTFYNEIANENLKRAAKLLRKIQDQYLDEREPYTGNLNTGGALRWPE